MAKKANRPTVHVVEAELAEPFAFRLPGSKRVWTLPNMQDLPIAIKKTIAAAAAPLQAAKLSGAEPTLDEIQTFGQAQIDLLERFAPGVTEEGSERQLVAVLKLWMEHSGIDLGESQASAS